MDSQVVLISWPEDAALEHPEEYRWDPCLDAKFEREHLANSSRNEFRKKELLSQILSLRCQLDIAARQCGKPLPK